MSKSDLKNILMANIELLMNSRYGERNISRFGRETGLSNGGTQRLLDPETDVRVAQLGKIADAFEIEPWQLLVPNLGQSMVLSPPELDIIRKMRDPAQPKGVEVTAQKAPARQPPSTEMISTGLKHSSRRPSKPQMIPNPARSAKGGQR